MSEADRSRAIGVEWGRARALAYEAPAPITPVSVPLAEAGGTTLAQDLRPLSALPAFDTAAMDGYAVRGPGPYTLTGRVDAGRWPIEGLAEGQAVAISTGAVIPPGAQAVLPLEDATADAGVIARTARASSRTHIRHHGEDARAGELLVGAGAIITPAMLGLAAACGLDDIHVRARPSIQVFVTGDELIGRGVSGSGLVRDALGPMMPTLVRSLGGEVVRVRHVVDDATTTLVAAIFEPAEGDAAVTLITGSTSVGTTDRLRSLLASRGTSLIVDGVACRPGHPQLLAGLGGNRWLVGVPGNPLAALVAMYTLLAPLLAGLGGRALPPLPPSRLEHGSSNTSDRTSIVPVSWDGNMARPIGSSRAASLLGAAAANALAVVPPHWTPGRRVSVIPMSLW